MRSAGRWIALLLLAFAAAVVVYGVQAWRAGRASRPAVASATEFGPPPASSRTIDPAAGGTQDLVALAGEGVWTRVDPETGRVVVRFTWSRLDPLESGEFEVHSPRLWLFEEGGSARLASPRGRIVWPSRDQAPESGRLEGGVELGLYERGANEDRRGEPRLRARTPSISFHRPAREVTAEGRVEVEGSGVRASGVGMRLRYDPDSDYRVSLLRVEREGRIEYVPGVSGEASTTEGRAAASRPGDAEAVEALYRVVLEGGVTVSSGGRAAAGERLTILARTINGSLREGAVAEGRTPAARREESSRRDSPDATDALAVEWAGPMELRPARDLPAELARDDVFVRFDSPASGRVEYRAGGGATIIEAQAFEYAATTRRLAALGGDGGVRAAMPGVEAARVGDVRVDLEEGAALVAGAGDVRLADAGADGGPPRGARWGERAELMFDEGSDGLVPSQVRLIGSAALFEGEASVCGDVMTARFEPIGEERGASESVIRHLTVAGSAGARDARGGSVSGEAIDVIFEADGRGRSIPKVAAVRGGARASREGESLSAELIEATLDQSADGKTVVSRVEARGAVVAGVVRADAHEAAAPRRIMVRADTLRADAALQAVELIGAPAEIAQESGEDRGAVRGGSMRVEGAEDARRLTVFGAGSAWHEATPRGDGGERPIRADVEWTGGMIYDDLAGRAEVEGGARARLAVGANERHEARGRGMIVDIAPPGEARSAGRRAVVRARVDGEDDAPAEVELRRYASDAEPRRLEGLAFLRGPAVELTRGTDHLAVEGPGVLLIEDRRPGGDAGGEPGGEAGFVFAGRRGTTLFSWEGGMALDRATGLGEMRGDVRIRHKDAASGLFTEVMSDRAAAHVVESGEGGLRLARAEAIGGVEARHRALVILGDRLEYDASAERFLVAAEGAGRVTIHDGEAGRTIDCGAASVDLASGRYRVERLHAGSAPR